MPKITLTGNFLIQLAGESKPSPIPLNLDVTYTEKSMVDYSWTTDQTDVTLNQGTVTAPKFLFVEVTEGSLSLSTDTPVSGAPVHVRASDTPGDSPGRLILFTQDAPATQWFASTEGPTKAKVWFFE